MVFCKGLSFFPDLEEIPMAFAIAVLCKGTWGLQVSWFAVGKGLDIEEVEVASQWINTSCADM